MSSITFDTFPNDLTLPKNTKLQTIPEDREINMSIPFPKLQTTSWADIMEMEDNGIFHPYNPLNFQPTVANWLESPQIDDDFLDQDPFESVSDLDHYDPENDYSPFPNPLGQRVYYNQEEDVIEEEDLGQICCKCNGIQEDNILLQISKENYYFCSECFYQEKQDYNRKNADYQVQLRQKVKTPQKYQFICPGSGKEEKLNFKVHIPRYHNEELLIIPAYKLF